MKVFMDLKYKHTLVTCGEIYTNKDTHTRLILHSATTTLPRDQTICFCTTYQMKYGSKDIYRRIFRVCI